MVEAKLADSTGKVIEVLTESLYGITVPAGQQVAFRMQGSAAASESAYASVQARVTSGETQKARPQQKPESRIIAFLVSWGPMLVLILVWVYLARKFNGKGSLQNRTVDLIAEQNAILTKQLAAIETIAQAAQRIDQSPTR